MPDLRLRLRRLQILLALRVGTGSIKLPSHVQRIHLRFAPKMHNGHMGPRKFLKHDLQRIKFHNPAVSITADRTAQQNEDPIMTVFFADADALRPGSAAGPGAPNPISSTSGDTPTTDHAATAKAESVSMYNKRTSEILGDLMRITRAQHVETSAEDVQLAERLQESARIGEVDRARNLAERMEKKRQADMLKEARGEMT